MHRETETWTSNQVSGRVGFKTFRLMIGPIEKYFCLNYVFNLIPNKIIFWQRHRSFFRTSGCNRLNNERTEFEWVQNTHRRTYGEDWKKNWTEQITVEHRWYIFLSACDPWTTKTRPHRLPQRTLIFVDPWLPTWNMKITFYTTQLFLGWSLTRECACVKCVFLFIYLKK